MDEADRAAQETDCNIIECLYRAQSLMAPALQITGACHYCDEPTQLLFCSAECAIDHATEAAQLKRMGR